MFDVLLQIGIAKLVVSAVLAGLAWVVQRRVSLPAVTHLLWLLVLVVLLLPAVVAVPVLPGKAGAASVIAQEASFTGDATASGVGGTASAPQVGPVVPFPVPEAEDVDYDLLFAIPHPGPDGWVPILQPGNHISSRHACYLGVDGQGEAEGLVPDHVVD